MKNNNHASKALAVVLSGALAFAPAANAALDESNMAYTSAAEGFYGSLRVQYANNESNGKSNDSTVEGDSRLGVRGDVDLGGGLEAFYGFEWNLGNPANADRADAVNETGLNTRQHHVGLKGDWGSVWAGAFDSVIVRFGGFSTTDILDQYSGDFESRYRTKNALAYISPDLNGFNFGIEVQAIDGDGKTPTTNDDGNDFDVIGIGASYSIQGLNFSAAYNQEQDTLSVAGGKTADSSQYALGLSYAQDNWIVAAMYGNKTAESQSCNNIGENDACSTGGNLGRSDSGGPEADAPFLSLAAGVSIDKFDFHGLWEQQTSESFFARDNDLDNSGPDAPSAVSRVDKELTTTAISARYHLGSKARLRAAWKNTEVDTLDGNTIKTEDNTQYALGMRVDF